MQFLATNDDAPRNQIGAGIGGFKVAVTPVVTDAIDHARSPDRDPRHLHRPHRQAQATKQRHVQRQHDDDAPARMAGVDVALHPVVGGAMAKTLHSFGVVGLGAVQLRTFPKHFFDAKNLWAVRIAFLLAFGVVFAVYRCPLLGEHAGAHPQPQAEKMRYRRVQLQRTVRLTAVQVQRHTHNGDVCERQCHQQHLPPHQPTQTVDQKIHHQANARFQSRHVLPLENKKPNTTGHFILGRAQATSKRLPLRIFGNWLWVALRQRGAGLQNLRRHTAAKKPSVPCRCGHRRK